MGINKKRFFITLGLSILIWIISFFIQALNPTYWSGGFMDAGGGCSATGYPLDTCRMPGNIPSVLAVLVNIVFWYWLVHLISGVFFKKSS
jgi:hypothetical protein